MVLHKGERVGLVGVNGSGKSTLLHCITGATPVDSGEISVASHCRVARLEQIPQYDQTATPWDVVMEAYMPLIQMRRQMAELERSMANASSDLDMIMKRYAEVTERYERANGFACETTARRILTGLGFSEEEFRQPFSHFSGGQKTRLSLARILAEDPDILLLDEPTNHLDLVSIEWLEEYLSSYGGSILLVSHDRRFLDKIATRIIDLHQGELYSYPGNYSQFVEQKFARMEAMEKAFQKQQEKIKAEEEFIRRYRAGVKARQARGRESRLQRLDKLERPDQNKSIAKWDMAVKEHSGQDVLTIRDLYKNYPARPLFSDVNLLLRKGEKAALIGPNGSGKSTLLKIIVSQMEADQGEVLLGSRVKVGYFAQEHEGLDPDNNVLEDLLSQVDCTLEEGRNLLGRMLFSGDDVFKKIKDLSGGEKARLALLKLLMTDANFLILDEPTNHMDMESRVVVEDMLNSYEGSVLMVSHDRYLIDKLVQRLLVLDNYTITSYTGNYSEYRSSKAHMKTAASSELSAQSTTEQQNYRSRQKENQRNVNRLLKECEQTEAEIELMEKRLAELDEILDRPETSADYNLVAQLGREYEELGSKIDEAYKRWEELNEQRELAVIADSMGHPD